MLLPMADSSDHETSIKPVIGLLSGFVSFQQAIGLSAASVRQVRFGLFCKVLLPSAFENQTCFFNCSLP